MKDLASRLNRRVIIKKLTGTTDSFGETEETYVEVAKVWASIEPITGKEFFSAEKMNTEVTTKITIRYRSDIKTNMIVEYQGVQYRVMTPPIDYKTRHEELILMAAVVE